MKKLIPTALLGVAGLTTVGLLGLQAPSVQADELAKRDEDVVELVLVADDDDDDTNTDDGGGDDTDTGASASTHDGTRSNFTGVSRDRDISRSDKTRDWTREGNGKKRDWSANRTNDRSRNDTRG
ncbi:hypothetical protein DDE18_14055 [Nocardioides gansuensis]|uniref:Uncharacterized protein n=1 Tax=Nocardioides gansuensis TaxID=2138300 RepID=A0A2T8F7Z5_9ACTN|nr:hypothetical protein [Nocardioides gansuensis]PVG81844.1 hypothetical protein DDE18_14055 [Nocardioides gansuensis]